jgi:hypothetical protein
LRQVMPVGDQSPWPALRERLPLMPSAGLDALLVPYAQQLAAKQIDPERLARVLQDVPEVYPTEYPMLLWALWSGSLILAELLPPDDPDLEVVRRRRTEIFEAIAAELAEGGSVAAVVDFDPFPEDDGAEFVPSEPDTFDMLMIDLALSPEMHGGEALRTPAEFALALQRRNRPWIYATAGLVECIAVLTVGGTAFMLSRLTDARFGVILGTSTTAFAIISLVSLWVWNREGAVTLLRSSMADCLVALLVAGVAILANWLPTKPIVPAGDFAAALVGIGGPLVILVFSAALRSVLERR